MKQEIKELRRRQIVDAALSTFATRGYDKTTMEDIRVASDVSKGTLYLYFDSKETLFAAVVEAAFADIQQALDQVVAAHASAPASDRLESYLNELARLLGQGGQRVGLYTDFFVQAWQHESVRRALAEAYTHYADVLVRLIQQGIDEGAFRAVDAHITASVITGGWMASCCKNYLTPTSIWPGADSLRRDCAARLATTTLRTEGNDVEENTAVRAPVSTTWPRRRA